MSEAELYELWILTLNSMWSNLQWWGGISFGLLALVNFAGKKLALVPVIFLSVLYVAFSYYTVVNVVFLYSTLWGLGSELLRLQSIGELSSASVRIVPAAARLVSGQFIPLAVLGFGVFFGALVYLWATYFKTRKSTPAVA
jgi:hypothetical protein